MLQHLPRSCTLLILQLFNSLWAKGILMPAWKHSIVIPVKKPGQSPHNDDSYRPIALTSVLCKTMERIIVNRLTWYIDKHHLLNDNQAGFRSCRSTIDQLLRLHTDANQGLKCKKTTLAVFIDFSKAFDLLWREGLLYKLRKKGITGNTYAWIADFMSKRTMQMRVEATLSTVKEVEMGTPQGSVLSPLLFLLMVSDFPETVGIKTSLFADDGAIWKTGRKVNLLHSAIQEQLKNISKWCDMWGFIINAKKTVSICFTRSTKQSKLPIELAVKAETVEHVRSAKFLGLIFDSKLTWTAHVAYIAERCGNKINLMRMLTGRKWGCSKKSLLSIYKALVRSVLDYGSEIFYTATDTAMKKLDAIQAKCLRICCGALTSSPIHALQNECGEMPLHLRRDELLMRHAIKIKSNTCNSAAEALHETWFDGKDGLQHLSVANKIAPIVHVLQKIQTHETSSCGPWELKVPAVNTDLSVYIKKKTNLNI